MPCRGNPSPVVGGQALLWAGPSDVCRSALFSLASSVAAKAKSLTFEITGDGNLPRVTIVRPVLCTRKGQPLLLFRRILLGRSEKLPLILKNSGSILVQVMWMLRMPLSSWFHCIPRWVSSILPGLARS